MPVLAEILPKRLCEKMSLPGAVRLFDQRPPCRSTAQPKGKLSINLNRKSDAKGFYVPVVSMELKDGARFRPLYSINLRSRGCIYLILFRCSHY